MKQKLSLVFAVMISFVIATGFTKNASKNSQPNQLEKRIITDNWMVYQYTVGGDNSDDYGGFNFRFSEDGSVEVTSANNEAYYGTYTDMEDVIALDFSDESILGKISAKWNVKKRSENEIALGDDYGRVLAFKINTN